MAKEKARNPTAGTIIRSAYNEEKKAWYFSITDVLQILTNSNDIGDYIKKFRRAEHELVALWKNEVITMPIQTGGGLQSMTVATAPVILRMVESVHTENAEPLKRWMANLAVTPFMQKKKRQEQADSFISFIYQGVCDTTNIRIKEIGETSAASAKKYIQAPAFRNFLIQLDKGFGLIAETKRIITDDGSSFFFDQVYYHSSLGRDIAIKLKKKAATERDKSQFMQQLSIYDEQKKRKSDRSTVGMIVCHTEEAIDIEYVLTTDSSGPSFARKYARVLPNEEELLFFHNNMRKFIS